MYRLTAIECTEYRNGSWDTQDGLYKTSPSFYSLMAIIEHGMDDFVKQLNVREDEVFAVHLEVYSRDREEWEIEDSTIIDNSPFLHSSDLILCRKTGQYQIWTNTYEIITNVSGLSTHNELFKRRERGSHKSVPIEVFRSAEDAADYLIENDIKVVDSFMVDLPEECVK